MRAFDTTGGGTETIANYVVDGAFSSNSNGISVSLLSEGFVLDQNGRFDFELDELLESDDFAQVTRISSVHRVVSAEGTDVRLGVEGDLSFDGSHADLFFKMDIDGAAGLALGVLVVIFSSVQVWSAVSGDCPNDMPFCFEAGEPAVAKRGERELRPAQGVGRREGGNR